MLKVISITIIDNALLELDQIFLKGMTIGESAVRCSDSVVNKEVPPISCCYGNPDKVIKYLE